jgi:hypothetical protein
MWSPCPGSAPGSFKCECGLLGVCFDPDKWCNCDSGHDDWLYDGGEIVDKQVPILPSTILQVYVKFSRKYL